MIQPQPSRRLRETILFFVSLLLLTGVVPAHAVDGLLEINQTCAEQTGCFIGDSAGLPVTITDGTPVRSFRLTSDLVVPNADTDGIRIFASNVYIDLNGFQIVRSGCEDSTINCAPNSGSGIGVNVTLATRTNVTVRDGAIAGMGGNGLLLGNQAVVENVQVRWNRLDGISTGIGSRILNSSIYQNDGNGIVTERATLVSGCSIYENENHGIDTGFANAVTGNTVYENGSDGIIASGGTNVSGNAVSLNAGRGIVLSANSSYRGNTITNNVGVAVFSGINAGGNTCDLVVCP